ncbi:MAG: PilZ domain-containing protein [Nitrospiraceae bacterium]|nr:MAG: PilZ domain-containing protein [Nitrospiraceae bacterium]
MALIRESCIKDVVKERDKLKAEIARYRLMVAARQFKIQKLERELKKLKSQLTNSQGDKRHSKRKMVSLTADLLHNDIPYSGLIDNLSVDGMHVRLTPSNTSKNLSLDSDLKVKFRVSGKQSFLLSCRKRWAFNTPPHGVVKSVGLEIKNPPIDFKSFVKTLS